MNRSVTVRVRSPLFGDMNERISKLDIFILAEV